MAEDIVVFFEVAASHFTTVSRHRGSPISISVVSFQSQHHGDTGKGLEGDSRGGTERENAKASARQLVVAGRATSEHNKE